MKTLTLLTTLLALGAMNAHAELPRHHCHPTVDARTYLALDLQQTSLASPGVPAEFRVGIDELSLNLGSIESRHRDLTGLMPNGFPRVIVLLDKDGTAVGSLQPQQDIAFLREASLRLDQRDVGTLACE